MLLGYARVSKSETQETASQIRALKEAGCTRLFEEAASGGRWERPELHKMLDQLRSGDTLVVWKLDRLSRSLKDLLTILERVSAAGAKFRSLTEFDRHIRPRRPHVDANARFLRRIRARNDP